MRKNVFKYGEMRVITTHSNATRVISSHMKKFEMFFLMTTKFSEKIGSFRGNQSWSNSWWSGFDKMTYGADSRIFSFQASSYFGDFIFLRQRMSLLKINTESTRKSHVDIRINRYRKKIFWLEKSHERSGERGFSASSFSDKCYFHKWMVRRSGALWQSEHKPESTTWWCCT